MRRAHGLHLRVLQQLVLPVVVALATKEIQVTPEGLAREVREVGEGISTPSTGFNAHAPATSSISSALLLGVIPAAGGAAEAGRVTPAIPEAPALLPQHSPELSPVGRLETGEPEEAKAPPAATAAAAAQVLITPVDHVRDKRAAAQEEVGRVAHREIPVIPAVPASLATAAAAARVEGVAGMEHHLGACPEAEAAEAEAEVRREIRGPPAIPEALALLLTTQKQ